MSNVTEPSVLRAGDPWTWRRDDLVDAYPASAWTFQYRFGNALRSFDVDAAADGDAFVVDLDSDATQAFVAGGYDWQIRATLIADSSQRFIVGSGYTRVTPNLFAGSAGDPADGRSDARKSLDAVNAMIQGRATSGQQEYTIGNRQLKFIPISELLQLRDRLAQDVADEQRAAAIAAGAGDPSLSYVRFKRG
jgi:hypothetical protein